MALRLKWWWIAGPFLACLVVAVSLLPPRGMKVFGPIAERSFRAFRPPVVTPANQRRMDLAVAWRRVDNELQAEQYRRAAEPLLAARQATDDSRPVLLLSLPDSMLDRYRPMITAALDSVWRQLGITDPKVSTIAVVRGRERTLPQDNSTPRAEPRYNPVYLLPDSSDRTTCLVILPVPYIRGGQRLRREHFEQHLRSGLGPCAFYARFGAPGIRVRRWLDRNQFDFAESSDWSPSGNAAQEGQEALASLNDDSPLMWRMSYIYSMRFSAVACLAGRSDACRDAVRAGDGTTGGPLRRAVAPGGRWRMDESRLLQGHQFLAEVVKQVGEASFQEFWTTTLPVDSALTLALNQPVGDWTARWQGTLGFHPDLGAAPRWSSVLLTLLLGTALVALVAWATRWREVR